MFEPEELGQRKDELAATLRELRRSAGLTGDRLAARCDISQSKISKIETGKALPSATDVERILSALGVTDERQLELMALVRLANTEFRACGPRSGEGCIRSSASWRRWKPILGTSGSSCRS